MSAEKPKCAGPVYFADQGIQVCRTCDGCICCDYEHVDHTDAERECFVDRAGICHLIAHAGRACQSAPHPRHVAEEE